MTENMNIKVTLQNAAKRGLNGLKTDINQIDKGAGKAAKSMKGFYTQLVGIAGLFAGGAFFGSAVKTFADFDDNMRAAAAVTSATTKELEKMTAVAKEMGRETRYTASQSAEALRFLGMAGFEATEATKALPGVLNLAAAGALDLGQAADIATNVLTSFGIEVEQLGQVNDVLVKTFTSSNVNLIEFGESFKMVGPIAKGVGSDFEDLSGAIGMLGNAGIKGTMAGVALKNAIDALLAPTGKEAALMKQLEARMGGVALEIRDSEGDFIGFKRIIEQLEDAGLRGDEALKAFGLRAGPAMVALLNQGSEGLGEMIDKLKEAGGTSKEIAEQMEAGLGGQLRKTVSVIESFKIAFGEAFGPEVIVILTAFREWLLEITAAMMKMKEDGDLAGIGQTIVDVFSMVNTVMKKTLDVVQSVTALTIAAGAALTGNFDLAKAAMEGWVKETNDIFAKFEEDDTVYHPITEEMKKAGQAIDDATKPSGPIGKGTQKVKKVFAKAVPSLEAKLKAELIKLNAQLGNEAAVLEAGYDQKKVSLEKYYDDRLSIITRRLAAERAILQDRADSETDVSKREILNAQIYALDQKLLQETTNLSAEKVKEQEKIDSDLLKSKEKIDKLRIKAEKATKDQMDRIKAGEGVTTLDTEFQEEIAALQNRQNSEMEVVKNFHEQKIQALRESKASELEIERAFQEQKAAIAEQQALQVQEQEQQAADQQLRLYDYRINNLKSLAGGASQVFGQLYEMMGSKNKELFYLSKAAAIAEATMNVAQGVTKAMAQGGVWGIAQGALVAAAGAVQISQIASQGLAEGGEVMGDSPHAKADNIGIMATAGEFMQPVSAVQHYGAGVMEAIRTKSIPKGAFAGYATGGMIRRSGGNRYAEGGIISDTGGGAEAGKSGINIINVTDPSQIDQYLSSSDGQDAVLNVLGARPEAAKRMLKGV